MDVPFTVAELVDVTSMVAIVDSDLVAGLIVVDIFALVVSNVLIGGMVVDCLAGIAA